MMPKVLGQLAEVSGVIGASVFSTDHQLYSTLAEAHHNIFHDVGILFEQVFLAAQATGKSHREAHVEFVRGMIIAYQIPDRGIILLLARKTVKLPMLEVSLKLATRQLKVLLAPPVADD